MTSDEVLELEAVPARIAVIGGGAIGVNSHRRSLISALTSPFLKPSKDLAWLMPTSQMLL